MNILIVDDHRMMLEGIAQLIQEEIPGNQVTQAVNLQAATDLIQQQPYELLLSDYNLPDGTGAQLIKTFKNKNPSSKAIILSMHDEAHLVKEVLKSGADAFILKKDSQQELIRGIQAVLEGKNYLSQDLNSIFVQDLTQKTPKLLSTREKEILQLIAQEYSNKQIADELCISERTVETHRKNIFRKTKTQSVVGLIKFAYANHLI